MLGLHKPEFLPLHFLILSLSCPDKNRPQTFGKEATATRKYNQSITRPGFKMHIEIKGGFGRSEDDGGGGEGMLTGGQRQEEEEREGREADSLLFPAALQVSLASAP